VRKIFKYLAGNRTVSVTWNGKKFYFNAYRNFGFATVSLDSIESDQRAYVKKLFQKLKFNTAFDIGANIGFWTVSLAAMMGRNGNIISIEPDRRNIIYLKKNTSELESRINILNIGLSSKTGTAILNTDETGALNSIELLDQASYTGRQKIDVETIDSIAEQYGYPDFIKLDVEGHEYEVIQGAISTLRQGKSIWLIEVTNNGVAVLDLLQKTGHTVVNMQGDEIFHPEYYVGAIPTRIYQSLRQNSV
jgi:FkbM family methyltransferase